MQMELGMTAWAEAGEPVGAGMPVGMREGAISWAPSYGLLSPEQEDHLLGVLGCYIENGADCDLMGDVQMRTDL